jgi:hypothetical protein
MKRHSVVTPGRLLLTPGEDAGEEYADASASDHPVSVHLAPCHSLPL